MVAKSASKRQVTVPGEILEAMGTQPDNQFSLNKGSSGFTRRPCRIDLSKLAPARAKIRRRHGTFDLQEFRDHCPWISNGHAGLPALVRE